MRAATRSGVARVVEVARAPPCTRRRRAAAALRRRVPSAAVVGADAGHEVAFAQAARQPACSASRSSTSPPSRPSVALGAAKLSMSTSSSAKRLLRVARAPPRISRSTWARSANRPGRPDEGIGAVAFRHVGQRAGQTQRACRSPSRSGDARGPPPSGTRPGVRAQAVFADEVRGVAGQVPVEGAASRRPTSSGWMRPSHACSDSVVSPLASPTMACHAAEKATRSESTRQSQVAGNEAAGSGA